MRHGVFDAHPVMGQRAAELFEPRPTIHTEKRIGGTNVACTAGQRDHMRIHLFRVVAGTPGCPGTNLCGDLIIAEGIAVPIDTY
jgi:hypothetical protein